MKLKIRIPDSLNDITLEQYQNFLLTEEKNETDILQCFYGIKHKDLFEIKPVDVAEMVDAVNKCFEVKPTELISKFKLNGIKFGFIPKLDDISYGENIDLTNYINEPKDLHKAMAVLFRPIIKEQFGKYLIEKYQGSEKYAKQLKQMPLDVVLSAQVFFYDLTNDLLNSIPAYLREVSQQHSEESGEAILHYTSLLEDNLRKLKELQKTTYTSV